MPLRFHYISLLPLIFFMIERYADYAIITRYCAAAFDARCRLRFRRCQRHIQRYYYCYAIDARLSHFIIADMIRYFRFHLLMPADTPPTFTPCCHAAY